jgi:predicted dehydrogenase
MQRLAIVGCGSIGRRHLQNVQHLGYTDVLVCDPNPAALQDLAVPYAVQCSTNLEALLQQEPTVVVVAAPSQVHLAVALMAARAHCHLFIEKPLAHTLLGLDTLLQETRRRRLITMVGCNMRFHPGPLQVKRWLEAGVIGQVLSARLHTGSYLPRWRPQQDYRQSYSASAAWGGAVLDCIHELDLALWLLGTARLTAAVTRPATSLGLATDGLAELLLEHSSGAISSVHVNFVQRNYRRSIEIIGSTGSIAWDIHAGGVELYGEDGTLVRRRQQPARWQLNDMYVDEMAYFLRCVQAGEATCNGIERAMQTLELALTARAAA